MVATGGMEPPTRRFLKGKVDFEYSLNQLLAVFARLNLAENPG
jgi:hypothetical protein